MLKKSKILLLLLLCIHPISNCPALHGHRLETSSQYSDTQIERIELKFVYLFKEHFFPAVMHPTW